MIDLLSQPSEFASKHELGKQPVTGDFVFCYRDDRVLLSPDRSILRVDDLSDSVDIATSTWYTFGELNGVRCFLYEDECISDSQFHPHLVKRSYQYLPQPHFQAAALGWHLHHWRHTNRFCGRCGGSMLDVVGERARHCEQCDFVRYPIVSPCVITAITRGDELLLARSPHFPDHMYSAVAGFIEPGETAEQTVVREVKEEVGIDICNLQYVTSQPWPFSHSLMLGYTAEYAGGDILIDGIEIEDAQWFKRDELPVLPSELSIARYLIDKCLAGG